MEFTIDEGTPLDEAPNVCFVCGAVVLNKDFDEHLKLKHNMIKMRTPKEGEYVDLSGRTGQFSDLA